MVYDPGFEIGKNFKTISKNLGSMLPYFAGDTYGYITPEYTKRLLAARPDLYEGITNDDLWKKGRVEYSEGDSGPLYREGLLPTEKLSEILAGVRLQRRGAGGLKDGRSNALFDAQGNLIYADKPYSYDPAGDTWKSAIEAAALGAAAFGGIGALGHGPLAGLFGGSGATGAASTGAGTTGVTGAQGAFLGEGVASGIGAWDAALANAAAGAGAAGGIGAIDSAFADLAASSGSLAPEGIGAIIPTGTELGAIGGGGILAGGALGGGAGAEASWLDKLLGKAGDKLTGAAKDAVKKILPGGGGSGDAGDWAKYILPALAGYASYKDAKQPTLQGYTGGIQPRTATQSVQQSKYGPVVKTKFAAGGGIPRYIDSHQDGMADGIGALIDGQQQAALSGGEFVVPADVVSHIGNGNSNAGAKQLYQMMDRIRAARTGTTQQGREINPTNFLPK